jgi:hypothetical protein
MADPFDKREWEHDSLNEINITSIMHNAFLMRRELVPYEKQKTQDKTLFPVYDVYLNGIDSR